MRLLALLLPALCLAQPYGGAPSGAKGAMPFREMMRYHSVELMAKIKLPGGEGKAVPAGTRMGFEVGRGMGRPRSYEAKANAEGVARFDRIPSNQVIQRRMSYQAWVEYEGVRFPFDLEGMPAEWPKLTVEVDQVTTDTSVVELLHNIDIYREEEGLAVHHRYFLYNTSDKAVNLAALPGGGLELPCPKGAKHPELHDKHDPRVETRGASIWYVGALLPAEKGPANLGAAYLIPYGAATLEWQQTLPVKTRGTTVAVSRAAQPSQMIDTPLALASRGSYGSVKEIDDRGRNFMVLRSEGASLAAGETLRFAVEDVPARSKFPLYATGFGIFAVIAWVLFGVRRPEDGEVLLSRDHLIEERDRLVKALARMKRAVEKGRLPEVRYEREREAITARLVTLYKALDRVE